MLRKASTMSATLQTIPIDVAAPVFRRSKGAVVVQETRYELAISDEVFNRAREGIARAAAEMGLDHVQAVLRELYYTSFFQPTLEDTDKWQFRGLSRLQTCAVAGALAGFNASGAEWDGTMAEGGIVVDIP